jgi:4,5-dihydroxyphthalate decarboxylase
VPSPLRLTIAVGDYDLTRPLLDGTVECQGLELIALTMPSPQRHWRMFVHREFDIAEVSLGSYSAALSRGARDFVGIPVFPHRRFRHGYVFGSAAAGVQTPEDLAGQSVGVRSWQTTAGIWQRGILSDYHGVRLQDVTWISQDDEDVPLDLPSSIRLDRVPEGRTVEELCVTGDTAGLLYPEVPRSFRPENTGPIRRLFPDAKRAEIDYFKRTAIFPIMHLVVIRRAIVESYPWVPRTMVDAFEAAKRSAMQRLSDPRTVSLAWLQAAQEEQLAVMGSDPWRYGLGESNRHTLTTFLRYAAEQGVAARELDPDELFHPSTIAEAPHYV